MTISEPTVVFLLPSLVRVMPAVTEGSLSSGGESRGDVRSVGGAAVSLLELRLDQMPCKEMETRERNFSMHRVTADFS
jgi:hypothetical protein